MFRFRFRVRIRVRTIIGFDLNNFMLPCKPHYLGCRVKVQSAIVRTGETIISGHSLIWNGSFNGNNWYRVSGMEYSKYLKFSNSQNNVQFYFLKCF